MPKETEQSSEIWTLQRSLGFKHFTPAVASVVASTSPNPWRFRFLVALNTDCMALVVLACIVERERESTRSDWEIEFMPCLGDIFHLIRGTAAQPSVYASPLDAAAIECLAWVRTVDMNSSGLRCCSNQLVKWTSQSELSLSVCHSIACLKTYQQAYRTSGSGAYHSIGFQPWRPFKFLCLFCLFPKTWSMYDMSIAVMA